MKHNCFGLLAIAGVVGGGLLVNFLLEKRPVHSIAAAVAVPQVIVAASERGYVHRILVRPGEHVEPGQALVTIKRGADPRSQLDVKSPCYCWVIEIAVRQGAEVVGDDPIVYLTTLPLDNFLVEAIFPADVVLSVGQSVSVEIEGVAGAGEGRILLVGKSASAGLYGLPVSMIAGGADPQVVVVVIGELHNIPNDVSLLRPGDAAIVSAYAQNSRS